jgi:hypothetical protein
MAENVSSHLIGTTNLTKLRASKSIAFKLSQVRLQMWPILSLNLFPATTANVVPASMGANVSSHLIRTTANVVPASMARVQMCVIIYTSGTNANVAPASMAENVSSHLIGTTANAAPASMARVQMCVIILTIYLRYKCECGPCIDGWKGDYCSEPDQCTQVSANPTDAERLSNHTNGRFYCKHGSLTPESVTLACQCECGPGWTGKNCDEATDCVATNNTLDYGLRGE